MNEDLRRSAAHVLVDDIDVPVAAEHTVHHLTRVLRLRDGERVTVTDGDHRWRSCRWVAGVLEPVGDVVTEPVRDDPMVLMVAVPKQDRPEWLVQKCTELGVHRIVFLHTERSVVRWDANRAERHLERLRRIAAEAAMQSRRVSVPEVSGPVPAADVLHTAVAAEPGGRPLGPADRVVAVGPEGGWTEHELALATDRIGLGPRILRVETAALALMAQHSMYAL